MGCGQFRGRSDGSDAENMRLTSGNGGRMRYPAGVKWNFRLMAPLLFEAESFHQRRGADLEDSITQRQLPLAMPHVLAHDRVQIVNIV